MTKNVNNIFCERLKALRKTGGMSQTELGEKLHLSRTAISYYEKGERVPNTDIIKRIAEHFNCSSDYLMGSAETPSSDLKIKAAFECMGLSEKAAEILMSRQVFNKDNQLDIFNRLIETEYESPFLSDNIGDFSDGDDCGNFNFYPNPKYQPILSTLIDYIAFEGNAGYDKDSVNDTDIVLLLKLHKMIIEFRRNFIESK